jgi:hypothetical protein
MKNSLIRAASRGKRFLVPLVCLAAVFLSLSCPTSGDGSGISGLGTTESWSGKKQKTFWAYKEINPTTIQPYKINTRLLAQNTRCEVWAEDAGKTRERVTIAKAESLANEFENNIYNLVTSNFGPPSDVDSNGKIIILLLDIQDNYNEANPSAGYTAGFFYSGATLSGPAFPYSNEADMIFVDTWPATPGDEMSTSTLAHEFQHLVNFNHHYIEGGQISSDLWINEGLSSAAEYLYFTQKYGSPAHPSGRITYYREDAYNEIRTGTKFVTWTNSLANYSTVYLFFQWLRIQAGETVYKKIAESTYKDYRAVEAAVWALKSTALGSNWADMLQNWFIANAFCNPTGIYGYKGDTAIGTLQKYPEWYPTNIDSSATISLSSGEGVYVRSVTGFSLPGVVPANIKYLGLQISSKTPAYYGPENVALVVNTNGAVGAAHQVDGIPIPNASIVQDGYLSLSRSAAPARSSLEGQPQPVDRVFPVDVKVVE